MVLSSDHYEVLDLERDAPEREVKRAFYRLLKDHPPEQKPKEYQRLREAYDVLSDPVARKEYDSMSLYGEEIEALQDEAEKILNNDDPDYAEAERLLKKAIVLGPEIGILRNLLGRCYLHMDRPEAALRQFERAVRINPGNEAYLLNKGHALEELERYAEAEAAYREVWERDEEDYAAPRALAQLLHKTDRAGEAHRVLDRAIEADGQVDFQDFFCLYDKLHFHLFDGEQDALRDQLEVIVRIAKAPADRRFAAFMLTRSASSLFDLKVYELANSFMKAAKTLDPDNALVQDLAAASREATAVSDGVMAILDDDRYHPIAKELVRLRGGIYLGHLDEDDARPQFAEVAEVLDNVMDVDPDATKVKASLRLLRQEHPETYSISTKLFDQILRTPAATSFRKPCPHCGEKVTARKGSHSVGSCPFCNMPLLLKGDRFEKPGGSHSRSTGTTGTSSQDSGVPGWVWVVGFFVFLWMLGAC